MSNYSGLDGLRAIMARLRDPATGCPWDREQTLASIVPYTIEEAYEVAEAIEREHWEDLKDELGDLLFQVVFYCRLAEERDLFHFDAVTEAIIAKLVRRHPHVFEDAEIADAPAQTRAWVGHKARERGERAEREGRRPSVLDGIGVLPGMLRALKLQRRAAEVGFDWPDTQSVVAKVEEEVAELTEELVGGGDQERVQAEVGDLLFACVNLARHAGVEPETALRGASRRFETRFRRLEQTLWERGESPQEASLEEMDALWEAVKRTEG
jgi:MazG family protein